MVSAHSSSSSMRCPSALTAAPAHTALLLTATHDSLGDHTTAALTANNAPMQWHAICSSVLCATLTSPSCISPLLMSPCTAPAPFFLLCSARLDCRWRAPGTNVLNSGTGCRTVVERAKPICPKGCVVIEQLRWNATVNRTQLFTKCSCKAGNQPCPSFWTACTCYEGFNSQNLTRGFVVCSETEEECDRKCNLAVAGNPRLAPLCPVAMDPFLSINPSAPPIYPSFGWGISSQARQTAVLGASVTGRSLKQLVGWGRRLTAAAADWQLHKMLQPSPPASMTQGHGQGSDSAASGVPGPEQQPWLAGACEGLMRWRRWVGTALLHALTAGHQELRLQ